MCIQKINLVHRMNLCAQSWNFCDPMDCSPSRLLFPWDFLGKNTGSGCHFLLQGIFPDQWIELMSLTSSALETESLPLHHMGSPLENLLFVN